MKRAELTARFFIFIEKNFLSGKVFNMKTNDTKYTIYRASIPVIRTTGETFKESASGILSATQKLGRVNLFSYITGEQSKYDPHNIYQYMDGSCVGCLFKDNDEKDIDIAGVDHLLIGGFILHQHIDMNHFAKKTLDEMKQTHIYKVITNIVNDAGIRPIETSGDVLRLMHQNPQLQIMTKVKAVGYQIPNQENNHDISFQNISSAMLMDMTYDSLFDHMFDDTLYAEAFWLNICDKSYQTIQ